MSDVSFEVNLTVRNDARKQAADTAAELFKQWEASTNMEGMEYSYDVSSGAFVFDTKGQRAVSPALMDDTILFLQEMGAYAETGAVVHSDYRGEQRDFAVGPDEAAKRRAASTDRVQEAVDALRAVLPVLPVQLQSKAEQLLADLEEL